MLRVSRLTDYGTMVMSYMARSPGELFSAADLADRLGLGVPTVAKVLKALARGDLLTSVRGLRGGYALVRPIAQITVADIVDVLEKQPFGLTECSATAGHCCIEHDCSIRESWQSVSAIVRRALEGVTLADMIQPPAHEVSIDIDSVRSTRSIRR
jgi:FeS assembly SUF system regulator